MKPSREDVRDAWHVMDEARVRYALATAEFERLRNLRYPRAEPTEDEMRRIEAMIDAAEAGQHLAK